MDEISPILESSSSRISKIV